MMPRVSGMSMTPGTSEVPDAPELLEAGLELEGFGLVPGVSGTLIAPRTSRERTRLISTI